MNTVDVLWTQSKAATDFCWGGNCGTCYSRYPCFSRKYPTTDPDMIPPHGEEKASAHGAALTCSSSSSSTDETVARRLLPWLAIQDDSVLEHITRKQHRLTAVRPASQLGVDLQGDTFPVVPINEYVCTTTIWVPCQGWIFFSFI